MHHARNPSRSPVSLVISVLVFSTEYGLVSTVHHHTLSHIHTSLCVYIQ